MDSALSLESTISSVFGFSQLDSEFQVIVVRCLIEDIVVICSLFNTKFPSLLSRYLPHLFPSDLTTIKKLLDYAKRLHLGVDQIASSLKTVFIQSGEVLFNSYASQYEQSRNKHRVNWEYVKALAHHYHSVYLVAIRDGFDV